VTLSTAFFVSQIIVGVWLLPSVSQIEILAYFGVGLYIFGGWVFGLLPVFEFRKKGGVKKGESYVRTSKLVDSGIYSVIRHPQFTTFILWAVAGMLLFQNWIVVVLGVPVVLLTYVDLVKADKDGIEKFGDEYEAYMKRVPRTNFFLGIIRLLQRRHLKARASEKEGN
jgi:protein-S-isoprenylcysteine O-methyltransferase Ste14